MEVAGGGRNDQPQFAPPPSLKNVNNSNVVMAPKYNPASRERLSQYDNFDHAVHLIKTCSKIIILTGAGISTSLGIPDFRSDSGLFTQLTRHGYSDPEDLFHIDNFRTDPVSFFKVASAIIPPESDDNNVSRFSPTHAFIKLLEDKDKLLTNYTQNIDGLELAASISRERVIQCHGSFATATCQTCGKTKTAKRYLPVVRQRALPLCPCSRNASRETTPAPGTSRKLESKRTKKRKRQDDWDSDGEEDEERPDAHVLKPDIVFYGEKVASQLWPRFEKDKNIADLVLIIGTSLQVSPVKDILSVISPKVPQIYISKSRCTGGYPDIELLGECDVVVAEMARRLGWNLIHEMNPVGQEGRTVKIETLEGNDRQHLVKLIKNKSVGAASGSGHVSSSMTAQANGAVPIQGTVPADRVPANRVLSGTPGVAINRVMPHSSARTVAGAVTVNGALTINGVVAFNGPMAITHRAAANNEAMTVDEAMMVNAAMMVNETITINEPMATAETLPISELGTSDGAIGENKADERDS